MAENDITKGQLFVILVPGALAAASVPLVASGLWPIALITGLAAVGAGIWGRRMMSNEKADEVLARQRDLDDTAD